MFDTFRISNLPPYAKLFVGLFTTLMLLVGAWAILLLYIDQGMIGQDQVPSYVTTPYGQEDSTDANSDKQKLPEPKKKPRLKHNVELAHTHINGQTLLFFAIGLVFLFTSVMPKIKQLTLWIFGVSVIFHAIGLTGQHYHWFYDDILAISGFLIIGSIAYMSFVIYVNLLEKPTEQ